jgi:hypothetical protein
MLPACKPNLNAVARTKQKIDPAFINSVIPIDEFRVFLYDHEVKHQSME